MSRRILVVFFVLSVMVAAVRPARGEAMLELFQMSWNQVSQKMPELAEAGYDSLWLPNPAKGASGGYSAGYDTFDPFDLGSTNQQGSVATMYGTQAQLIQMVQMAHRFGIRIYFDNVMNHRSSTPPGFNAGTPTNFYPGLVPQDFHLQTLSSGFYANWPNIGNWCYTSEVQNQPLEGLSDLANEPGTLNWNFGNSIGATTNKPVFIRFPGRSDLYMDTNGPLLGVGWGGAGWRPFDGHGQPVPEDVTIYLCRAVAWTLYTTKCDGFRLDAVKHVPVQFFGNETGQTDDPNFVGYTGAIQAMFDYVHGYGSNVTGNGYVETDGNRNSLFNTEATRNDAMIFGEYEPSSLAAGQDYYDYLNSGMRLLNQPLYTHLNNVFYNGESMAGMDSPYYTPPTSDSGNCDGNGNFSMAQAVNMPQTQDNGSGFPPNQPLEDSYLFMHEGQPMVYSDGFNHNPSGGYPLYSTPIISTNNYLGEYGDNTTPDVMYLHNQLSRGGTWTRWSDQNIVAFERYDYRESTNTPDEDVVLFVMNNKTGASADITYDDGVGQAYDNYYGGIPITNSKGQGLVVGFPPGSVLVQLASSSPTAGRAYQKLLVHGATQSFSTAQASINNTDPSQRLIYVGSQTLASGGGAIELNVPTGSWVMYGYQWPEASRANPSTNAIVFKQGGVEVPHLTVYRTDGANGDTNYNPLFPFKMRGSVDAYGNVIGGVHVSNRTYAIDVPVVTNGNFDILVRSDASSVNTLVKLDGGIDLNSQMGLGPTSFNGTAPTNFLDLRDNKPGYATDVFLGYEQTTLQFRNGPEKFAAKIVTNDTVVSLGAETYYYAIGGTNSVVTGSGYNQAITNQTATWVYHDPAAPSTVLTNVSLPVTPTTQMVPTNPAASQSVDIYVKVGYKLQINTAYIYYTTDGSNPEGAFGIGKGTTQVAQAHWVNADSANSTIDWWKGTIPGQPSGTQVRYKIALFNGGSYGYSIGNTNTNSWLLPISDAESSGSKLYGLTQNAITNFNPTTAVVWLHNDLNTNNTTIGLQSGFHIVRARTFLPRNNKSSVYNTFLQTFYYDGALPNGVITSPVVDGGTISNQTYTIVVRADSSATEADFNIQDGNTNNDDIHTGQINGNGNDTNGQPIFVAGTSVTPNTSLSAQYPNYPQEFHFTYANVPTNGGAIITVRLKEYGTTIYPNRFATLTRSNNAAAPTATLEISNPSIDGEVFSVGPDNTFTVQACFSTNLDNHTPKFTVSTNGKALPRLNYSIGSSACGSGKRTLTCNFSVNPGNYTIQVGYTNGITTLSDTKSVTIAPPLRISGLSGKNQYVTWDSAPGLEYQVLATTNLTEPFLPVSGIIPATTLSTTFYDAAPTAQKFYEVQVITNTP